MPVFKRRQRTRPEKAHLAVDVELKLDKNVVDNYKGFTFQRSVDEKDLDSDEDDDNLYVLRTRVSWGAGKEGQYEELVRLIRKK